MVHILPIWVLLVFPQLWFSRWFCDYIGPCGLFVCSLTYSFSSYHSYFAYIILDLVCIMSHFLLYFYHLMYSLTRCLKSFSKE